MSSAIVLIALLASTTALPGYQRIDPNGSWRVVGGTNALPNQYPSIGSLRNRSGNNILDHFCGCTILNTRWVLTAANCVVNRSLASTGVVLGTNMLNAGGVVFIFSRGFIHGSYSTTTLQNDISVLETSTTISWTIAIQQVSLTAGNLGGGLLVVLAGWGTLSNGGSTPNNLQHLGLNTITVAQCQSAMSPNPITATQICAVTGVGSGACHGDAGGPLYLSSNLAQAGVASWGIPCGLGHPDVYARTYSYLTWIQSAISQ